MDVAVVEILSEIELTLIQLRHSHSVALVEPYLSYGGSRDMYQSCARLQAELDATFGSAYVHLLYVVGLGEVLDIRSTVENSGN